MAGLTRNDRQIPVGWQVVRLGEMADFQQGGTPPKHRSDYWDGQIPFVTGADLRERRVSRGNARSFLTVEGLNSGATVICEPGALLLATRTRVGLVGIASETMGASQDITLLKANGLADTSYLYRTLTSNAALMQRRSRGTTIQGVTREDVNALPILLPPLSEQRAIAAVLDSIDEAIERTDAVIAATERLRDALLHELLTRGVPGWHTEWKEVPGIGVIPADWEVVRLGDVAEVQTGRAVNRKAARHGNLQVPYLSVANVKDGYVDLSVVKTMVVSEAEVGRYRLQAGDVILTEGGDADKLGRGTVWRGQISPCLHQNHIFAVRPCKGVLHANFLASFAGSARGKRYFLGAAKQTTNLASINSNQLKQMPIALPDVREQTCVVDILSALDGYENRTQQLNVNLQQLKTSTAAALLTGQVRLSPETLTEYG